MAVVAFNYQTWALRFPELAPFVGPDLAQLYWNEAGTLYVDNTATSIITDDSVGGMRAMILNFATAHIATLWLMKNGQAPAGLVGKIIAAAQGSVSVQVAPLQAGSPSEDWWAQTVPGFAAWQALAPFRTAVFAPGPYNRFQFRAPFMRGVIGWPG